MIRTSLLIVVAFVFGVSIPLAFPDILPHPHEDMTNKEEPHDDTHIQEHHAMEHTTRETDTQLPIPTIHLDVKKDMKAGYNVFITTENFTFLADKASLSEAINNEGHGHLYVNDKKVARVYGHAFHVDDTYFTKGVNEVRFTLNAHDHSEWTINGVVIQDTYVMQHK